MSTLSTGSGAAAVASRGADADARILAAVRGSIEPVRVGGPYRLGLLAVAVAMLVLPVIYLGIILMVLAGVAWYAVNGVTMVTQGRIGQLLLYLGPLIIGLILALFMIKPLFAKRREMHPPLTLRRSDQPLLYAFVDKLCGLVGAPRPVRIDVDCQVNASASFDGGLGGFLRRDLVLTIGLPLIAGMDLRHISGVLAHELGHFAQGTGMRLTYIIRAINTWFYRVVYERDSWDDWLTALSRGGSGNVPWGVMALVMVARGFIWLTRRLLWLLMLAGHGISTFMLRQMEFDADRYEARIAGSDIFGQTSERLAMLNAGAGAAFRDLGSAWREKRLCDNLPALVHSWERDMPDKVRHAIARSRQEGKTEWFDTHPSDPERLASALRERAPGVVRLNAPASALFRGFDDVCRAATMAFYERVLDEPIRPENLITTGALVSARGEKKAQYKAARRYFQGLLDPVRPVFFSMLPKVTDRASAGAALLRARTALQKYRVAACKAARQYAETDRRHMAIAQIRALRLADIHITPPELELGPNAGARVFELERQAEMDGMTARQVVDNVLVPQIERLKYALALAKPPLELPEEDLDEGEYALSDTDSGQADDVLVAALGCLSRAAGAVQKLRLRYVALGMLLTQCRPEGNSHALMVEVISCVRDMAGHMKEIHVELLRAIYPYDHANGRVNLAQVIVPAIPPPQEIIATYEIGESVLDGIYDLYMRVMSDLAHRAEQVEADLGLPPLPEPPEEPEQPPAPQSK